MKVPSAPIEGGTITNRIRLMTHSKIILMISAAIAVAALTSEADAAKRRVAKRVVLAPAAAAKVLADAPHDARFERGYVCFTDHFHYGSSGGKVSRAAAQASAISSWSSFVDFEYGGAWASFSKAGSKKVSCTAGSGGWECSAEARPCK